VASELLVRVGHNDQDVIADLLAPGGASIYLPDDRPIIDRLVVDAHLALDHPRFAEAAVDVGTPVLVDPLTPLLQGEVRPDDAWARLPFGQNEIMRAADLNSPFAREQLVQRVVDFEVENGATAIIPPYPYVTGLRDPWFEHAIDLLRRTARYMRSNGVNFPLVPVLTVSAQGFAHRRTWADGLKRYADVAVGLGSQAIALSLSPIKAKDGYDKVLRIFLAYDYMRRLTSLPIIGWRQGFLGPGLVAAGLTGYETGAATSEFCDMARTVRSRQPRKDGKKGGGGGLGIYVEPLGRTVPPAAANVLFDHDQFRAKVMCGDQRCCPAGITSTKEHRREHAVRTRARALAALDALPHPTWRLHQVSKDSQAAITVATQANRILEASDVDMTLATEGYQSVAAVADYFRTHELGLEAA
jgi:hypothetical protein